ncbi:membrane protein [Steroidobacter denitrificans]|uniref:Membrane protein n=1 Tax=Steroidobacter denitrificans TaxID=465721 RepID=A0A127FE37_STEDE|nr:lipid-A-disaccharide synthase N-terminal domain-containing protein [Steroidobacter denitrificans]AMN48055.1 membrane protein [Steroidobacter denitrificans]
MSALDQEIMWLGWTGLHMTPWKLIGLTGAMLFGGRWLIQFVASRRAQQPMIPRLFWYMSLGGSLMALSYFLFSSKQDAVGALQNLLPAFTAAYSLYLDICHGRRQRAAEESSRPLDAENSTAAPANGMLKGRVMAGGKRVRSYVAPS